MTGVHAKILGLAAFVGVGLGLARAAHSATGLTACLAECNHAKLSATNKASCRLDCEQDAASDPELIRAQIDDRNPRPRPKTTTPTTPATTPSTPATRTAPAAGPGCKAACDADRTLSVDDRATCKLECDLDPDSPVNRSGPDVVKTPPPRGSSPLTFQLAGPPPSEAVQAGFIDKCYATCQQGPYKLSATDFETCKLDCQTMASVVDVARGFVPDVWTTPVTSAAPTTPAQPTRVATNTPPVSPTPAKTTPPPRASGTDRSAVEICGEELSACNERCTGAVKTKCERGCSRKHLIETDRETCKLTCETDTEVCQGDCLAANATCVNTRQRQR